jgi:AmmeMemoRadiSam system protein B
MAIREAAVCGQFYPGDPNKLRNTIESYGFKTETPIEAKGIVVPHAGYVYSGSIASEVFSSVRMPRRILILGPNHTGRGAALALAPAGSWKMPLGNAFIDEAMNSVLLRECPVLEEDSEAHRSEHAIEVQLPFIQLLQPDFHFSAICVQTINYAILENLGHAIARTIQALNEPILLVSSSDMTHYETADEASLQDRFAINRILDIDPIGLYQTVLEKQISMCGFAPTISVLIACKDMGAKSGQLIRYTNSGEASGDYSQVVAYAGIAIS